MVDRSKTIRFWNLFKRLYSGRSSRNLIQFSKSFIMWWPASGDSKIYFTCEPFTFGGLHSPVTCWIIIVILFRWMWGPIAFCTASESFGWFFSKDHISSSKFKWEELGTAYLSFLLGLAGNCKRTPTIQIMKTPFNHLLPSQSAKITLFSIKINEQDIKSSVDETSS